MVVVGLPLLFFILTFVFGAVLVIAGLALLLAGRGRRRLEHAERAERHKDSSEMVNH
jgi:membrane protein implicated in regulation of membrane protease activity